MAMSVDKREFKRLCKLLKELGWRVSPSQHRNGKEHKVMNGSHMHAILWPPDGVDVEPVAMSTSGDPNARRALYAALRRSGVEADPCRQQQAAAKARRRQGPGR